MAQTLDDGSNPVTWPVLWPSWGFCFGFRGLSLRCRIRVALTDAQVSGSGLRLWGSDAGSRDLLQPSAEQSSCS